MFSDNSMHSNLSSIIVGVHKEETMTKNTTKKIMATLFALLIAFLFTSLLSEPPLTFAASGVPANAEGRKLFMQYCATCHGSDAKGNGPSARTLKKAPADLTKIEKVDGKFPTVKVQRIISGDDMLESHGSRDMPIWGTVLRRNYGPGFATLQIYNLTRYLESIQQ